MAVRLRLQRLGRTNRPFYRIVAANAQSKRDGKALENLGHYDPLAKEDDKRFVLRRERVEHWLSVGAQPSDTVATLLKRAGVKRP